jgi:hypothetical protein
MNLRVQAGNERPHNQVAGHGQRQRVLAAAVLALTIAAVAVLAFTGNPEPAQACLLPGIPC